MTTKTRAEMVRKVAENVGLAQPGEVLSAKDASTIDGAIDPAVAMLAKLDIADIGNVEEIELDFSCRSPTGSPTRSRPPTTKPATPRWRRPRRRPKPTCGCCRARPRRGAP